MNKVIETTMYDGYNQAFPEVCEAIYELCRPEVAQFILDEEGNIMKWLRKDLPQPSNDAIAQKVKEISRRKIRQQIIQECEDHIYTYYPQSKQASDTADKNYYETLLKAKGVQNLEADIVSRAKRFFEGESLEEVVADVADEDKEAYVQLLKVAVRVEWVQQCKAELKAAMKEEREPNFPDYPL